MTNASTNDTGPGWQQSMKSRPTVGVPIHETALVRALEGRLSDVYRPGPGRSTYVLLEPELGQGRPDLMLVTISSSTVASFLSRNLRVPSLAAARALDKTLDAAQLGISEGYARSLRKSLTDSGWNDNDVKRYTSAVHDVTAVEAKMSDWTRALRQAIRFKSFVDQAVILMPSERVSKIKMENLEHYQIGLMSSDSTGIRWELKPTEMRTDYANRIWALELLLRGIDRGTAYRFSPTRKISKALRIDSVRLA